MLSHQKKVLSIVIFSIFYFYLSYSYIDYHTKNQLDEKYKEISLHIKDEVKTLITEKQEAVLLISLALSENDKIKDMLLGNRANIDLEEFSVKLKRYSSLHNAWFQVVSNRGVSMYRSWTKKHGDNLLHVRKDIWKILDNPHIYSTISVGKYDITFKSIVPIFEAKKFIGLIETITKFNSIARKMRSYGYKNILLVDKQYKKQLKNIPSKLFVNNYYIANKNADRTLKNIVKKDIPFYIHNDSYIVENNLLITTFKILDIDKKDMAYFIFSKNIDTINVDDIKNHEISLISALSIIYIIVISALAYFYFINYKKFIQQQNNILEDKVEEKTKELIMQRDKLKYQAHHDALTKLPNRILFLDRIEQALKNSKHTGANISVMFLDLDRFKEINDTYGHEVGDKLLQLITKRLLKILREEDTIARLGGDEFIVLLKGLEKEEVIDIAENIIQSMQKPFLINKIEIYTTFSIGISSFPEDGKSSSELLKNADTAMYKAKESGKNNYYFYNAKMTELAFKRIELDKEMHKALENREFIAYFQPKIDAKEMKVVGLEALIRWQHPTKGLIFPNSFIPFAEETGFIDEIDNFMMKESMKQVLQWHKKGIECGKVSINISSRQLNSKTYFQELKNTIDEIGIDTNLLEIEITETHIMNNPEYAMEILNKIKDLGISISIDDFGTGYSSLSYLKKLPVTKLKIDRSFIIDLPAGKEDIAIVRTIISLAKNLNLDIIAEGAETKEQVDCLVSEGCHDIQGYYFSKPLSVDVCEEFLINFK